MKKTFVSFLALMTISSIALGAPKPGAVNFTCPDPDKIKFGMTPSALGFKYNGMNPMSITPGKVTYSHSECAQRFHCYYSLEDSQDQFDLNTEIELDCDKCKVDGPNIQCDD